jgi:PAS domain S-box-containing protein
MLPLQFLLLEDKLPDAEAIQSKLMDGGLDYELSRVKTWDSFVEALENRTFDLVLADYNNLLDFEGNASLDLVQSICPNVPFIFLSDTSGEETAIEALKRGATDYILKQRLERLVPSIQRALQEAQEQRDRSNSVLRQHGDRLREVAINLPNAAVFIVDRDLRYLLAEGAALQNADINPDDLVGKTLQEALDPALVSRYEPYYRQLLRGEPFGFEHSSHDRWYISHGKPLYNEQGEIDSALVVSYDITDRKQAEAVLRHSEARLRLMVESAKEYAIFTLDLNGFVTSWNSGAERLLGYEETEAVGRDGRFIFTPEDNVQGKADREIQIALSEGQAENERWHMRKDGSRFWASGLVMPLQTEEGEPQGLIKIMQDKTHQRQSTERFQLLYDTTRDLLATEEPLLLMSNLFENLSAQLDLHHYYNYIVEEKDNRRVLHLKSYGGIPEEMAQSIEWLEFGQYPCGLVAQEEQQIVFDRAQLSTYPDAESLRAMEVTAYAGQPLIVQGRLLGVLSFASQTRSSFTTEEIDLLQSTCEQIAIAIERTNLTKSIQQQAEQLQRVNRIKDEFLAVLSHELRSPLNPILGWSRLLQSRKFDATRHNEALATIERNAKLQLQLVEDLLDISRIIQGKLSLQVAPVNLTYVISAAIETVRLAAESKKIQIRLDLGDSNPAIMGDSARLQQVVWNLLTNAVKFSPGNEQVKVELRQIDQWAQIRVIDKGKGIHRNFLPHVFEHFRQEDGSTTRKFGGLGLGLAIVQQIVEMHGGTVRVESQGENQGATFIVQLPLMSQMPPSSPEPTSVPTNTAAPLDQVKVLLVDDDRDTREYQAFLLQQNGATVTSVDCGVALLTALTEFVPDVIISDVGMAEMDGYTLMQQIRALPPDQGGMIPAIAVTAYATEIDQKKAQQAGFQSHITKPVEPNALIEKIISLIDR